MSVHARVGLATAQHRGNRVDLEEVVDSETRVQVGEVRPRVGHHRHAHASLLQLCEHGAYLGIGLEDLGDLDRPAQRFEQARVRRDAELGEDHSVVVGVRGRARL
jgi:hypothetical protein